MAIGDVVRLTNGKVGVVGGQVSASPLLWRVFFGLGRMDVTPDFIAETLTPPAYEVGDTVYVWPHSGTVTEASDPMTVSVKQHAYLKGDQLVTWDGELSVPVWRVIKDTDSRIDSEAA